MNCFKHIFFIPLLVTGLFTTMFQMSIFPPCISNMFSQTSSSLRVSRTTSALRPIIFIHGVTRYSSDFQDIIDFMHRTFGSNVPLMHSLPLYEGSDSLHTPMSKQRDSMVKYLLDNADKLGINDGFNIVAHSQGALLSRAVIQVLPQNLRVLSFVSLAGPQNGQFGMCKSYKIGGFFGLPDDVLIDIARPLGWAALYNPVAQDHYSFANYWFDPHTKLYNNESKFLPQVNGWKKEIVLAKINFLRIGKAIFLGSPDDDCIDPPQSSLFQYVDENEKSQVYLFDTFGLKTMLNEKRCIIKSVPGMKHMDWLNVSAFENYVLPELQ